MDSGVDLKEILEVFLSVYASAFAMMVLLYWHWK
tara:strand:- start:245 stop:346 length:102 start_codon:yes stop_codon:yes gene_type:complete